MLTNLEKGEYFEQKSFHYRNIRWRISDIAHARKRCAQFCAADGYGMRRMSYKLSEFNTFREALSA